MRNFALRSAVFLLAIVALSAKAHADCGSATNVIGKVTIKRAAGGEGPLNKGDQVCQGDTVSTDAGGRAAVTMPGDSEQKGNVLNVNPNSALKIENYEHNSGKKKVLLNVLYGKMRATVNSKYDPDDKSNPQTFQVKTKSAVAGVRGTDFLTSFSNNKMQVVTFEGKVEVGKAGPGGGILNSVQVGAGFSTTADGKGTPSAPKAVPPAQLEKMNKSSSAPASGGSSTGSSSGAGSGGGEDGGDDGDKKDDGNSSDKGDKKEDGKGGDKSNGDKNKNAEGDKNGEKGNGDKKADKGSGGDNKGGDNGSSGDKKRANNGGDQALAKSPGGERAPASDSSGGGGGTMVGFPPPPPPPPPPPTMPNFDYRPPGPLPPPQPPTCDFCNTVIQNGPAKVNVKICLPGQC